MNPNSALEFISFIFMLVSIITLIMLILYKDSMKSTILIFLAMAISLYLIGNYIEISNKEILSSKIGLFIRFIGIPFIPTLWFLCVREFCGLKIKNKLVIPLLLIIPLYITYLNLTWESNQLLFTNAFYINNNNNGSLNVTHGPLYKYMLYYQYIINFLGFFTIVTSYRKGTKRFKQQSILFFVSTLIPIFNTSTYIINIGIYHFDITPFCLLFSMVLFSFTLFYFGVLHLSSLIKHNSINHLYEGILLFDRLGIYMDSNLSACEIFPQIKNISLGTSIDEMDYLPFDSSLFEDTRKESGQIHEFTRAYEGVIKTFTVSTSKISIRNKLIGYSVILNNITPIKKLLVELEEKSITDPLTNIYNRGYLFDQGNIWVQNSKNNNGTFSVIMIDVDFFKKVNDTFGHVFGDYILKTVTFICSNNLRSSDILARYGGEEFCILLSNSSYESAIKKAELLRLKISSYVFENANSKTNITASFGVSSFDSKQNDTFTELIKKADDKLYEAKSSGRNRVC